MTLDFCVWNFVFLCELDSFGSD